MTRPRRSRRVTQAALAIAVVACAATAGGTRAGGATTAPPSLAQMVGQRLVVGMSGSRADASLLDRIRKGKIAGVILFSSNIVSPSQLAALTASIRAAAVAGGQPRPIIATDQEGGLVKRIPWAPPNLSAQALGGLPTARSLQSGSATGRALRTAGVNVDLAPVADIPAGPSDFIAQQMRAFSTNRFTTSLDAKAFAQGLETPGVWPTLKHFPGLGRATVSTDVALVKITAGKQNLVKHTLPYQVAIRAGLHPIIMLSTAVYPALDWRAAAWSPPIIHNLLRSRLGFAGTTITDSLDSAAAVRHESITDVALKSAKAGADLLLVTGSEAESQGVYKQLLAAARAGKLPVAGLTASYNRILTLKSRLN
jgi:beta-N-acetylhexosaminidase